MADLAAATSTEGTKLSMDSSVELINGRFLDVISGRYFEQGTRLFIKGGTLEIVNGMADENTAMKPGFTIDLHGKTVIPGLFNVHCHIQSVNPTLFSDFKTVFAKKKHRDQQVEKSMADCLVRGITNIRDAWSNDLGPNRKLKDRIQKGEIPGPRILQAVVVGPIGGYLTPEFRGAKKILMKFMGLCPDYKDENSGVVTFPLDANELQVRDAVDKSIDDRGADLIKVGESLEESLINSNPNTMTIEQLQAITDQSRRRGVQSTIHCVSLDTFRRSLKAGFSSMAHMPRDSSLSPEDIYAFLKSDCIIEPTLSVGYDLSWKLEGNLFFNDPNMEKLYEFRNNAFADLAAEFWVPDLKDCVIAGFKKANLGKYTMLGIINMSKTLEHFCRLAHHGIENTKMLVKQGATMACGNDGGIQACTPAMVAHELGMFDLFMNHDADGKQFNEITAIQTATINSAKSMGIDDKFGSIETGKTADIVVVNGDPLQDSHVIGSPAAAVFMDGNLVINNCELKPVPLQTR